MTLMQFEVMNWTMQEIVDGSGVKVAVALSYMVRATVEENLAT